MRINIGKYKGRSIILKPPIKCKPTTALVRKSVFDMISSHCFIPKSGGSNGSQESLFDELSFLDVCSGSGICGIEAISVGMKFVKFLELDILRVKCIKKNLDLLAVGTNRYEVSCADVRSLTQSQLKYDVAYLDPPYDICTTVVQKCLTALHEKGWLAQDALLFIESDRWIEIDEKLYEIGKMKRFGDTRITTLRYR